MSLFSRKKSIIMKSEQQKDAYIEKLENAHVDYDVFEDQDALFSREVTYIIRVRTADLKKVG